MARQIIINSTPQESRVALMENARLLEIGIERSRERGIAGSIYKGRVSRVLPGMQAAFIDVGLERTAFLHAADIAAPVSEDTVVGGGEVQDIRRLVNEDEQWLKKQYRKSDPPGFLVGPHAARLSKECIILRDSEHRGPTVLPFR